MSAARRLPFSLLGAAVLLACGASDTPLENAPAGNAVSWPARRRSMPPPSAEERAAWEQRAMALFARSCTPCHLREGSRDPRATRTGIWLETAGDIAGHMNRYTVGTTPHGLWSIIAARIPVGANKIAMPPPGSGYPPFTKEEIHIIGNWNLTRGGMAARATPPTFDPTTAQVMALFARSCTPCHRRESSRDLRAIRTGVFLEKPEDIHLDGYGVGKTPTGLQNLIDPPIRVGPRFDIPMPPPDSGFPPFTREEAEMIHAWEGQKPQ